MLNRHCTLLKVVCCILLIVLMLTIVACDNDRDVNSIETAVAATIVALEMETPDTLGVPNLASTPVPTDTPIVNTVTPRPTSTPTATPVPRPTLQPNALSRLEFSIDEIEGDLEIYDSAEIDEFVRKDVSIGANLYVDDSNAAYLLKPAYTGDDWIFFEQVLVRAGDTLFEYDVIKVAEDVMEYGGVFEAGLIPLEDDELNDLLEALESNDEVFVRLRGSNGDKDFELSSIMRRSIEDLAMLYYNIREGTIDPTEYITP